MKTAVLASLMGSLALAPQELVGLTMVKDLFEGPAGSFPSQLCTFKGKLLFVIGADLWSSDGTPSGTKLVAQTVYPTDMVSTSKTVYFYSPAGTFLSSIGRLWRTNGTPDSTNPIAEITPSGLATSFSSHPLVPFNNEVYFRGISSTTGGELWKSNGTQKGTFLLKDIFPGASYSRPDNFVVAGKSVYFTADDGTHGNAIWKSDGTTAGTRLFFYGAGFYNLTKGGENLYFCFNTGIFNSTGSQLWKSSGDGALLAAKFDPFSSPTELTDAAGKIFFSVESMTYGKELWMTDGMTGATRMVKDINEQFDSSVQGPGNSNPTNFCSVGKVVYFSADNGLNGEELWRSDGTSAGTYMVANINPAGPSSPRSLTKIGNKVYFTAYQDGTGRELWVTDGTMAGTEIVKDIYPGISNSDVTEMTDLGGNLFFVANDGIHGFELWTTKTAPAPDISVEQPAGTNLVGGKSKRVFGRVKVGLKGRPMAFYIKNSGSSLLAGINVSITGAAAKDFVVSRPRKNSVSVGKTEKFSVTFKPKKKGFRSAMIRIRSNDKDENPFEIKVSGVGM